MRFGRVGVCSLLALVLGGTGFCGQTALGAPSVSAGTFAWQLPPGFPVPLMPPNNPMSLAKVELGRWLFFDPRLSGNGSLSCAGCHQLARAFTDGRAHAVGATGAHHRRSTMSLVNVAYNLSYTWAGPRVRTLEQQARIPLFNRHPIEMGMDGSVATVLGRLRSDEATKRRFRAAFPGDRTPISVTSVVRALASFERTLIGGDSAFDRFVYRDEHQALSPASRRGMDLFFDERLGCSGCHGGFNFSGPVTFTGASMTEPRFHNTALYNLRDRKGRWGTYPRSDLGLRERSGRRRDTGRFRAPTLRNVALTAPYMHDGSVRTLGEVVAHYAAGGRTIALGPNAGIGAESPLRSPRIRGFAISQTQTRELVAFLESLTDRSLLDDPRFQNPFTNHQP